MIDKLKKSYFETIIHFWKHSIGWYILFCSTGYSKISHTAPLPITISSFIDTLHYGTTPQAHDRPTLSSTSPAISFIFTSLLSGYINLSWLLRLFFISLGILRKGVDGTLDVAQSDLLCATGRRACLPSCAQGYAADSVSSHPINSPISNHTSPLSFSPHLSAILLHRASKLYFVFARVTFLFGVSSWPHSLHFLLSQMRTLEHLTQLEPSILGSAHGQVHPSVLVLMLSEPLAAYTSTIELK